MLKQQSGFNFGNLANFIMLFPFLATILYGHLTVFCKGLVPTAFGSNQIVPFHHGMGFYYIFKISIEKTPVFSYTVYDMQVEIYSTATYGVNIPGG